MAQNRIRVLNAVVLGSQFVMAAQTIVSRKVDPLDNAVVTFGIFNAEQDTTLSQVTVHWTEPFVH